MRVADVMQTNLRMINGTDTIGEAITLLSESHVSGVPVVFDDFDVSVRDDKGEVHAFTRSPQLKVVRNDPFAMHDQLLDVYTDKNMHDMLAYLVTLK